MQAVRLFFLPILILYYTLPCVAQVEYAQKILDSLEKVTTPAQKAKLHNDLGFHLGQFDSLQGNYHARMALKIANAHNLIKEKASAYKNLGLIHGHLQYQQTSLNYYDSAYHFYQLIQDTSGLIAVLNNSGRRNCYLGNCEKGIGKYQLAEKWMNPQKIKVFFAIRINHAICLMECKAYQQCLLICQQSIDQAIAIENIEYQFHFYYLMGNSLAALDRNTEAIQQFDKAMIIAKKQADLDKEVHVLNDRVPALMKLGKYQQAYQDAQQSLKMKETHDLMKNDFRVYLNLAEAAKKIGQLKESIHYYEIGISGAEATVDNVILASNYEKAAEVYHLTGAHQKAYEYMLKAKSFRDTVFTNEMRQNLQEITTRYETEKIKKELASSNLKIEQEQNRSRLTLLGSLSVLVLCSIGYFFFRSRQKQQKLATEKRKIELEYGLLRAQMNPHFIFNSLNSIQGYFADNQFVQGNEFLGNFSRLIRRVLDQSVTPAILLSEELETLKLYLDVEKNRLKDQLNYEVVVKDNVEIDLIKVPPLVLQPFAENAIWHGIAPKNSLGTISIHCQMSADDQFLEVIVEDDGVGLTPNSKISHESRGIQITRERLGKTGDVIILDKKENGQTGVTVQLKIPIIDHD